MAVNPADLAKNQAAVAADLGAPQSLSVAVSTSEEVAAAVLAHAGTAGVKTSEFWATVLTPVVTFAVSLVGGYAAARGLGTPDMVSEVAVPVASTLVTALATRAASAYAQGRAEIKKAAVALHLVA